MRNFYNDLTINECFEYLSDVFDKDKKNYFFVHTFTIGSLIQKKINFQNKDIRIVNLVRNPYDVLNSSIALARNGYDNSIVMKKHIIGCYGNILSKINADSVKYVDFLSKSIGLKKTMLTLFAVDSVKIMLDEFNVANSMGIKSYYIEELTNEFEDAESFLKDYVSDKDVIKKDDVISFQKSLGNKSNIHSKEKKDTLLDSGTKLLKKVLNSNNEEFKYTKTREKEDISSTSIQNLATDFYRDIDLKDLQIKKEVLQILHNIIESHVSNISKEPAKKYYFNGLFDKIVRINNVYKSEGVGGIFKRIKKLWANKNN